MTPIVESIEISRRPEDVFAYITDPSHFPDWQEGVESAGTHGDGPLAVGSNAVVTRRVLGRDLVRTQEEVTELSPPNSWGFRGESGLPVTGIARGTVEPLDGGQRSRVTISLAFEGHGIGRLLIPLLIRRQARMQLPRDEQKLKQLLERDV